MHSRKKIFISTSLITGLLLLNFSVSPAVVYSKSDRVDKVDQVDAQGQSAKAGQEDQQSLGPLVDSPKVDSLSSDNPVPAAVEVAPTPTPTPAPETSASITAGESSGQSEQTPKPEPALADASSTPPTDASSTVSNI